MFEITNALYAFVTRPYNDAYKNFVNNDKIKLPDNIMQKYLTINIDEKNYQEVKEFYNNIGKHAKTYIDRVLVLKWIKNSEILNYAEIAK